MVTSWVKDNLKLSVGQLEIIAEYIKSMRELDIFGMMKGLNHANFQWKK